MPEVPDGPTAGKYAAARRSVDLVEDGMRLGLGTGSTADWMVRCLAARVRDEGLAVTCVATSSRTARTAIRLGLHVVPLDEAGGLDLTIDGADEFDARLDLIKGGGGAHLQEKIVAAASDRMVVITDPSKEVARLGAFPLPVEVLAFGLSTTRGQVAGVLAGEGLADARITVRSAGEGDFVTDEGNRLLDLHLGAIPDAGSLSDRLLRIPGVVETGLFLGMCDAVIVGHEDGRAAMRERHGAETVVNVDLTAAAALPEAEDAE